MAKYRWQIEVDVDDDLLAEHDGDRTPPPNDPGDWIPSDLATANRLGIVDLDEAEFLDFEAVAS